MADIISAFDSMLDVLCDSHTFTVYVMRSIPILSFDIGQLIAFFFIYGFALAVAFLALFFFPILFHRKAKGK